MYFPIIWGAPLVAFFLALILSFFVLRFFPRLGLMDRPERYGHKRAPIPYPGGISIALAFTISVLLFFELSWQLVGFLAGIVILTTVSFLDDRIGVHPILRLFLQIFLGILLISTGTAIVYISNPFGPTAFELAPMFSALVTIAWIMGVMNTVNWLDGVPGVAAGTSTLAGVFLGILALTPYVNQPELALLAFLFAGANAGFFVFNIPPPKMLSGDTGAMFSGFVIAVLSTIAGGKIATVFLVLALPLFDAATVIFHRLREHRSPLHGRDEKHLHDQLRKRGWSDRKIMLLFLTVSALLGLAALYLKTVGKLALLVAVGVFVFWISWQHHRQAVSSK